MPFFDAHVVVISNSYQGRVGLFWLDAEINGNIPKAI
jgi:hypothetical protein